MKKSFWKSGIIALCLVASMSILASCNDDDKKNTDGSKDEVSVESKVETSDKSKAETSDESNDETSTSEDASRVVTSQEATSEESTSEEASSEYTASEETASEEVTSEETASEDTASEDTTSDDVPATKDTVVYTDGSISFEYPKGFTGGEQGSVKQLIDNTTGNNIALGSSAKTNVYHEMTEAIFNTTLKAQLESMGMTVTDYMHEVETNEKSEEIAILSFTNTYSGMTMKQVLFAVNTSDKTYIVTVTEVIEDEDLVKLVFDTLDALN